MTPMTPTTPTTPMAFESFRCTDTIISIVQKVMQQNDMIQVGAPTGAAAFNVQGSTLHHLLGINVSQPEELLRETTREQLKS